MRPACHYPVFTSVNQSKPFSIIATLRRNSSYTPTTMSTFHRPSPHPNFSVDDSITYEENEDDQSTKQKTPLFRPVSVTGLSVTILHPPPSQPSNKSGVLKQAAQNRRGTTLPYFLDRLKTILWFFFSPLSAIKSNHLSGLILLFVYWSVWA